MIHPDIGAMCDVIADMTETTDSMTVEEAVHLRESIVEMRRQAATLLGLIDTQLVTILESPRVIEGILYEVKSEGKWRPDHGKIVAAVKQHSVVDTETGEMSTAPEATERAMKFMKDLYVSPSGMPKSGGLSKLGLDKSDVAHYEKSGNRLSATAVVEEPA